MKKPNAKKYIVFEGIDGTGKTTQIEMVRSVLVSKDYDVLRFREPSDLYHGKKIRSIMEKKERLSFDEEMELFINDRKSHVNKKIIQSLQLDAIILQDRSYFSNAAYQGSLNIIDYKTILGMNEEIAIKPDVLLIFFSNIDTVFERMKNDRNSLTYMERKENLIKVNAIYEKISDMKEYNSYKINADAKIPDVTRQIINILVKNEVMD